MGMVFKKNGEFVSTGAGAAVMGHPARAVAWMANRLYKIGQSIKPGEVVLSGSLSGAVSIAPGTNLRQVLMELAQWKLFLPNKKGSAGYAVYSNQYSKRAFTWKERNLDP
ncbi:hypothetical protein [Bacillus sp. T3]|uniref:hypothetical protein n=1 Tax=Bacillus sp. T3 TaxID=467262 RepID=UPI00298104DF|nr:hypothetical protein [Bacillus sp. T3]